MAAKNLTLTIEEELLDEARVLAARRRTTVSAMVREHLRQLVEQERERDAAWQTIRPLVEAPRLVIGSSLPPREELHRRAS